MAGQFDGVSGLVAAKVMARVNRDMEAQAIERLSPAPSDRVLVLGFGPGVGIELLLKRLARGRVRGVDPSAVMVKEAARRNRAAIAAHRLELVETDAAHLPFPDAEFDGAIAVNSIQLWEPLPESSSEVARVLRPGARLVSLTHDWAITRHAATVEEWLARTETALLRAGLGQASRALGSARSGRTVGLVVRRLG
ncbi:MAG TPA: methyltransferase domain-containing protein [Myxococcota bacterium]|nr:methyltransferase domain-containing protein [Myxococcota bacterium]